MIIINYINISHSYLEKFVFFSQKELVTISNLASLFYIKQLQIINLCLYACVFMFINS